MNSTKYLVLLAAFAASVCTAAQQLSADDLLFIGNSYTFGAGDRSVQQHGGVPKLIEAIAASKGKAANTLMVVAGGKDWGFHLEQPKTKEALSAKNWDSVILQDQSTKPTRLGRVDEFLKNGETFYKRIRERSPRTRIVLYETWARAKGSDLYTGVSTPQTFVDPTEMTAELEKAFKECQRRLEALEPGERQAEIAPVGEAFARCLAKYPNIGLYADDNHHASAKGSYLAALIIYATVYIDSPMGATTTFPWGTIESDDAKKLQQIAEEVTIPQRRRP